MPIPTCTELSASPRGPQPGSGDPRRADRNPLGAQGAHRGPQTGHDGPGMPIPAVLAIWGRMDGLLEDRDGQPKWNFPHFERVEFGA